MKKLLLFSAFLAILLISGYFYFLPKVRWQKAAQSAGGYSYQIGLTSTSQASCIVTEGECVGGTLCPLKAPGICANYSEISGSMAGGMGTMALFSLEQTTMAGYKPGDSIIAGGMTMTEMDNGVLASPGGCAGCGLSKAESSILERIAATASYIIAGIKDRVK